MNGGDGAQSYVKNSSYQRGALDVAKPIIEEEIAKNLKDIEHVDSALWIADFGCSTGHNSFPAMQIIIDAINKSSPQPRECLVLFNDVASNDFKTLLRSLPPHRGYQAAVVPGYFHGRLLPRSSLHFAYSSWSLHWLSEVPKAVGRRNSPAWNKGRILYSEDRQEVCDAYVEQLEKDMGAFLEARAVEIVGGGGMALLIPGAPAASCNPQTEYTIASHVNLLGSCLMEMAKRGRVREEEIDSFNLPYYFPTLQQLKAIVHKSQSFSIERADVIDSPGKRSMSSVEAWTALYRAVHERLLIQHFGHEIIDELFRLFAKRLALLPHFHNPTNDKSIVILLLLKRNKY